MKPQHRSKKHGNAICFFFVLIFCFFPRSICQAEDSDSLLRIDQNGLVIEYLPSMTTVAKQLHPWLVERLKQAPFDVNRDVQVLQKRQQEVAAFIRKELAQENSTVLEKTFPKMMTKYQNIGNVMPNLHHIQVWHKKELKQFLDGGGTIPGYEYTPGPDGKNQLTMAKGYEIKQGGDSEPLAAQSLLFPVIIKTDDPAEYLDEAKKSIEEILTMQKNSSFLFASVILLPLTEAAVKESMKPELRPIKWFHVGVSGYLTWRILQEFISKEAADQFLHVLSIKPYLQHFNQVHLVKWVDSAHAKTLSKEEAVLQKARQAFSIYEIMGLVKRNGPDTMPALFKEIARLAPYQNTDDHPPIQDLSGKELVESTETLLEAIQNATGEDFRPRLIQYSLSRSKNKSTK